MAGDDVDRRGHPHSHIGGLTQSRAYRLYCSTLDCVRPQRRHRRNNPLSIEQNRSAGPSDKADPFLRAVAHKTGSPHLASTESASGHEDLDENGSGIAAIFGIALLVVALVAALAALVDGARRADSSDLASQLAVLPGSVTMPVQSPFVDTTVRLVENQSAALWQQDDGSPALRLAKSGQGAIAALVNDDGIPVALGVVPPGLSTSPERMLISPVSTALTVAATHPDVLSVTSADSLGRLAVVARSGAFSALAGLVDGATPIASLGPGSTEAAGSLGASLITAIGGLLPTCIVGEIQASGVVRCEGAPELQNTGLRAVPVLDATGQLCGLVPPASFTASAAEEAALIAMIVDGLPFDGAASPGTIQPGTLDLGAGCQGNGTVPTQGAADEMASWRGQTELIDVALPLARIIGADANATSEELRSVDAGALSSDSPSSRLTNATLTMRDDAIISVLGLQRTTQATDIEVDGLIQSTIARLFE